MPLRRPRGLVFDWDNTLVDSWLQIHRITNLTLEAMGHPAWSLDETKQRIRASARDSFPRLFGERSAEAMAFFTAAFEAGRPGTLPELPGTGAALRALGGAGAVMSVVSNKQGSILRQEVARMGWDGHFHRLVGAGDAARDKPAAEPIVMALAGSGLEPGPEIWLVGDTDTDLLCAHNSGCTPVLLRAEPPRAGEFEGAEPALHVATCEALVEQALNP